jgi:beta-xylosidase
MILAAVVLTAGACALPTSPCATPGAGAECAAPPVPQGPSYTNPVISDDIADPDVIEVDGTYYLYPTSASHSYSVWTSNDLVHWNAGPVVFTHPDGSLQAPDVYHDEAAGIFYLYFNAAERIGVATSTSPTGPFTTVVDRLVDRAIDANVFRDDDGRLYLYYVRTVADLFDPHGINSIWVQPMSSPTALTAAPVSLIDAGISTVGSWKFPIAEAPWMLRRGSIYYLMFSGNVALTNGYAVGYATSTSPTGPFVESPDNPIAAAHDGVYGPGHHSVVTDGAGTMWMVYHQKKAASNGWERDIAINRLWFEGNQLRTETSRGQSQAGPWFPS